MTALTLAVDASTYAASVALIRENGVVREYTVPMRDPKHERLMPAIAETLRDLGEMVEKEFKSKPKGKKKAVAPPD